MSRAKPKTTRARTPKKAKTEKAAPKGRAPVDPHALVPDSMLRLAELQQHVPLSRTSIYRGVAAGTFPRPKRMSVRTSAWRWGDILEWSRSREEAGGAAVEAR